MSRNKRWLKAKKNAKDAEHANTGGNDFVIMKLDSSGELDDSFDEDGIRMYGDAGSDQLHSIFVDSDENIYAAGYSTSLSYTVDPDRENKGGTDFVILKLNPDGTFNNNFHNDGKLMIGSSDDERNIDCERLFVGSNGWIYLYGSTTKNAPSKNIFYSVIME